MNGAEMRERMRGKGALWGLGLRLARTSEIARLAKSLGFDWLFVDMEHNPLGIDTAAQICVAALDAGLPPLVRVPGFDPIMAARLLDGGAAGIVVPHVDTPDQILPLIEHCRFAPRGRRSLGGLLPQLDYAPLPTAEAMRLANERTLICAMIESPRAVAEAEALAAVDGVDMLLFGSNDLAIEMGIPGQLGDGRLETAYRQVIEAAARHGKAVGLGGVYTPDLLRRYLPLGFNFALLGSDLFFLVGAARAQLATARDIAAANS